MEVEGSDQRWKEAMRGGGEQKEVTGLRGAIRGGWHRKRSEVEGCGEEQSEAEGSDQKWREVISLTEVERSNQRRRGAIRGGREQSEVEGHT